MMRRLNMLIFFTLMTAASYAQFVNNGATVTIQPGATLRVETDFTNTAGTITNNGTLEVSGNFTNATGAGATLTPNIGLVKFIGSEAKLLNTGGDALNNVEMAKTMATGSITLSAPAAIDGNLAFTGTDNNKIILGTNDLTLASASVVSATTNHPTNGYVVTNATGSLVKTSLNATSFTYPVGFNPTTYNPIAIAENGTSDNIGVRVLENAYENGAGLPAITSEVVDASWVISETTAGGSNLTVTPQWNLSDELMSFTRADCGVSKYVGPNYDLTNAGLGAASGSGPYTRTRAGVTPGTFVVGDDKVLTYVALSPKAFLSAYSASTGLMTDSYRSNSVLPSVEPYTGYTNFTYVGRKSGESVGAGVFSVTGNDAIVDWVFLQIRNVTAPYSVVATKSALIQRDGDIVDVDGVSPVKILGVASGTYKVAIRHRNHLAVMTNNNKALSSTTTVLNFTDNVTEPTLGGTSKQVFVSGTNPAYALRGGDGNVSGSITASDNNLIWLPSNGQVINNTTYLTHGKADFNMNRIVQASDSNLYWLLNNGQLQGFSNN